MNITFRTDASLRIGTGHVMRCLTLADALRRLGNECCFVTRELPGNLVEQIKTRGFACHVLQAPAGSNPPRAPPSHASWAEVSWQQDALETRAALSKGQTPDWLVLDHYAFDRRWEAAVLTPSCTLMVIDDLADRPHIADVLLDQNLGREAADYDDLLPRTSQLLIGPAYALLRPEFAELRAPTMVARTERAASGIKHLLIALGGVDLQNVTAAILRNLPSCSLPADAHVSVVMGRSAPGLSKVQELAKALPWSYEVLVDVIDMASLMAKADLAIGAAGTTTWERCCLGLPCIIVPIADNQVRTAKQLAVIGAGTLLALTEKSEWDLKAGLEFFRPSSSLARASCAAAVVCDGQGVAKVLDVIYGR